MSRVCDSLTKQLGISGLFEPENHLVTGANRGIGLELCRQLHNRGDNVIAACRSSSEALEALQVRVETDVDVGSDKFDWPFTGHRCPDPAAPISFEGGHHQQPNGFDSGQ